MWLLLQLTKIISTQCPFTKSPQSFQLLSTTWLHSSSLIIGEMHLTNANSMFSLLFMKRVECVHVWLWCRRWRFTLQLGNYANVIVWVKITTSLRYTGCIGVNRLCWSGILQNWLIVKLLYDRKLKILMTASTRTLSCFVNFNYISKLNNELSYLTLRNQSNYMLRLNDK